MAISLSYFPILSALLLVVAEAATVTYDFNITWVHSNPDGAYDKPTIGINGQWPIPIMRATVGDRVIVNVDNQLGNESTSLHFHGLYQNGTNYMDGPVAATQCGIGPGVKFTYNFTVDQPGTYWYHSHTRGQYPDGLRGPLIIEDPDSPYKGQYDEEIVLSVSDHYHELMTDLLPGFIYKTNPTGAEPVPNAALLNDTQNLSINLEAGKTYFFRMVNIGAFAGQYIWFEGHNMTIVEVDGIYTESAEADMIYIAAAQRVGFLLTAKNSTDSNYAFVASMDTTLFDQLPEDLMWNSTGWLVYDDSKPKPNAQIVDELNPFDDFTLIPYDKQELLTNPDQEVELTVIMDNLGDGGSYAFFNNITYTAPKVPTLYTVLSSSTAATNPAIYGQYTHPFVLAAGETVQITLNNADTGRHPFHLHGHAFQAVHRSAEDAGEFNITDTPESSFPKTPMRRDTFMVYPTGNIVLRFRADNPGVWLFHCHIEWHVASGLSATMIEAPLELQKQLEGKIPADHLDACKVEGTATSGNAAGNTVDFLDLRGQNAPPGPLPAGFTPRGIVAMTFSVLAAVLGCATIAWYGLADMGAGDREKEEKRKTAAAAAASSSAESPAAGGGVLSSEESSSS